MTTAALDIALDEPYRVGCISRLACGHKGVHESRCVLHRQLHAERMRSLEMREQPVRHRLRERDCAVRNHLAWCYGPIVAAQAERAGITDRWLHSRVLNRVAGIELSVRLAGKRLRPEGALTRAGVWSVAIQAGRRHGALDGVGRAGQVVHPKDVSRLRGSPTCKQQQPREKNSSHCFAPSALALSP